MPTFGERLRDLRIQAGLTQEGLATASGLPLGSIRNYEQGQREPLWDVVFRITGAMGVSAEEFRACVDGNTEPASAKKPAKLRGRTRKER